jgi:two-component system response regulator DctR
MADWKVLIVEDDPTVARIHCRFVGDMRNFRVVGVAGTAAQAMQIVTTLKPHLILLDLGLPGTDGLKLLRHLRGSGASVEVIAVTAASSSSVVSCALQLGVVDYLVKPFFADRLRQALGAFLHRMVAMQTSALDQRDLDGLQAGTASTYRWLPRDIARDRLDRIRDVLATAEEPLTASEAADRGGVARVTARRYLEYLVTVGDASVEVVVHGRGRPRKMYRLWTSAPIGHYDLAPAGRT